MDPHTHGTHPAHINLPHCNPSCSHPPDHMDLSEMCRLMLWYDLLLAGEAYWSAEHGPDPLTIPSTQPKPHAVDPLGEIPVKDPSLTPPPTSIQHLDLIPHITNLGSLLDLLA